MGKALKLLDDSIAEAKRDHKVSWIRTLCQHAAIVSRFTKNLASAQQYYEESLPPTLKRQSVVRIGHGRP